MNQREAKRRALESIASLIDVNANSGDDGDLMSATFGWSDEDYERFRAACNMIAEELAARAQRMVATEERRRYGTAR